MFFGSKKFSVSTHLYHLTLPALHSAAQYESADAATTKETMTYFFTVLFLPKNGRKVARIARFMKNFKKLASKYYSETWNPSLPINFLTDITFDGWILTGWVELTFFSKLILNYFCSLELACLTSAFKKEIYEVEFKMFIA